MKIALAQINTKIGDFSGNLEKIRHQVGAAQQAGADWVVFPELTLTGYPPQDLLEQHHFVQKNKEALQALQADSKKIGIIVGFVEENLQEDGKSLLNAAALLVEGRVTQVYAKRLLPTYDVFDEARYFASGTESVILTCQEHSLGVTICEDIWNDKIFWESSRYQKNPVEELIRQKITCLINIAASPYGWDKEELREEMICALAKRHQLPVLLCNLVGANDELVFDGRSLAVNAQGEIVARADTFKEDLLLVDLDPSEPAGIRAATPKPIPIGETDRLETLFQALVLGVRDYAEKCGFQRAVLGLSGGIDSSLTAVIAAEALGPENVFGLLMPSTYTSPESIADAEALAQQLGLLTQTIPIDSTLSGYQKALDPVLAEQAPGITEENLQARIRGNLLMAVSNQQGHLVLSTGNKSELAVGYCTLYGDMSGGLAVLSDLPKTMVYQLARWYFKKRGAMPERVLTKPPSAELRPNQKDSDSLPPYEVLDSILKAYIEEHQGKEEIVAQGFDAETVDLVIQRVTTNEYKRRQMPVGIKVSKKAFGIGRRFPIARETWK